MAAVAYVLAGGAGGGSVAASHLVGGARCGGVWVLVLLLSGV